jgi:hypothetical protein
MLSSFGALQIINSALEPEIAEITPEVVELFLMTDKSSETIRMFTFQMIIFSLVVVKSNLITKMSLVKSSQTHYFTHSMNKHDTMS